MHSGFLAILLLSVVLPRARAEGCTNRLTQVGFSRIIHGWTNYSTGFSATHDLAVSGDFATVASVFTPSRGVVPEEYAVIVVWLGEAGQTLDFARFSFSVGVWSGLRAFTEDPRAGDLAQLAFLRPTGGSLVTPDAYTRGGRAAYELRFCLTNAPVLSPGQTYLIGFAAHTDPASSGELYVPTSSHSGPSDLQAGNLVLDGWLNIVDAGGSTIYDGQLATELLVTPPPSLVIDRLPDQVIVSWQDAPSGIVLEAANQPTPDASWLTVVAEPSDTNGVRRARLSATGPARYFRLRK
jgi:hypothetical protein